MERVLGIGGFYFRAQDPEGLARWYATCLGVDLHPQGAGTLGWNQLGLRLPVHPDWAAASVPAEGTRTWMLSFRVRDLDSMVRQLRSKGVEVAVDPEDNGAGRFARFADPEGNPVSIWELQGFDARE
jgi:glyoxylase I family protein